jgi:hypothetical protein
MCSTSDDVQARATGSTQTDSRFANQSYAFRGQAGTSPFSMSR